MSNPIRSLLLAAYYKGKDGDGYGNYELDQAETAINTYIATAVRESRISTELSIVDKLIDTYQQHGTLDGVFQKSDLYNSRMKLANRLPKLKGEL
jgi:hypothetical protein